VKSEEQGGRMRPVCKKRIIIALVFAVILFWYPHINGTEPGSSNAQKPLYFSSHKSKDFQTANEIAHNAVPSPALSTPWKKIVDLFR
jgi:hypothetical protein